MDQPRRLLLSGKTCAALVLLAACLLVGCAPSSKGEVADVGDGARSGTATSDEPGEQPNIILILTDDLADDDLSYMPNLRSLLIEQGTTFENAFVTDSLCCPSRATILRGQYAHNHGILENGPPNGGYEKFRSLGRQSSTLATWLQDAGYRTVLIGKYMNDYEGTQVPPGWNDWHAVSGNYTSHDLNENGKTVSYDPGSYYGRSRRYSRRLYPRPGRARPVFPAAEPTLLHVARHDGATPARRPGPPSRERVL